MFVPRPTVAACALLALSGCLDPSGAPDLGGCAEAAGRGASYGEIGIGTCLAGPVSAAFFTERGATWLAVANADPFDNFASGSALLIPWDAVDLELERNLVGELGAAALPVDAIPGALGVYERADGRVLALSDRLSPGSLTQDVDDRVLLLDITDPAAPAPWPEVDAVTVREDPGPIAVDPTTGLAYVANTTDRSLSVLDLGASPIAARRLGDAATVTPARVRDADGSGSRVAVIGTVTAAGTVPTEVWRLDWIAGTTRLWAPEAGGVVRYSSGGAAWVESPFGVELDPEDPLASFDAVVDPFYAVDGAVPQLSGDGLVFADAGDLLASAQAPGGGWTAPTALLVGGGDGWDAWRAGPSAVIDGAVPMLFFDGRAAPGAPAAIGRAALASTGQWVAAPDPVLEDARFESLSQPYARVDAFTRGLRLWASAWDGAAWSVVHAASADGRSFSAPEVVLSVDGGHAAAPVVQWANGRYEMFLSVHDGLGWVHARAESVDGLDWTEPEPIVASAEADLANPPRAAAHVAATSGWRLTGETLGPRSGLVIAGTPYASSFGFSLDVASGHVAEGPDLGVDVLDLLPVSIAEVDGAAHLFASARRADGGWTTALLRAEGEGWAPRALDLLPGAGARNPVVAALGGVWHAWYAVDTVDGGAALAHATSPDGLIWTEAPLTVPERAAWEVNARVPHAVEPVDGGGVRLWYAADDGARWRIGAMTSADGLAFAPEPGADQAWQLGPGEPGRPDDSGVRDPVVAVIGDQTHLWYAGSPDGTSWQILHATRAANGEWERDSATTPALFGVPRTFSTSGVESPVLDLRGARPTLWYAGTDGLAHRVGRAVGGPAGWFPAGRPPTPGDYVEFATVRGGRGADVIPLAQSVDGLTTTGASVTSLRLDEERGFLYVAQSRSAERSNYLTVLDVRDDSAGAFLDRNALGLEAVLLLDPSLVASGIRDALPIPGTDRLLLTAQNPDAVVALDLSGLVDDDRGDLLRESAVASWPLLRIGGATDPARPFSDEDAGADNQSPIAGAGLALLPDGHTVLVAHYRDNSVIAIDTALGAWGEEVRRIPNVGENPHRIVVAPSGRHAVVLNYLGEVDERGTVHSNLAVIDVDPASERYLEVVTWLVNR